MTDDNASEYFEVVITFTKEDAARECVKCLERDGWGAEVRGVSA